MRIPPTQSLKVEDFPEQKKWIAPMFYVLNKFFSGVIAAINGGIEFGLNIAGQEHVFDFTYQSAAATFPLQFRWTLLKKPQTFQVVACSEDGSSAILLADLEYTTEGFVRLNTAVRVTSAPAIAALNVGSRYTIRVRCTP